jgi:transposase
LRYTTEFKLKCVKLYRQGKWIKTPKGIKTAYFHSKIRIWDRIEQSGGPEALCHKIHNKAWSPEEKLELVSQVKAGQSMLAVACQYGISVGLLYQWVRKYREEGYNGLVSKKKGRHRKDPPMKRNTKSPKPLNETEREELVRLRAENACIKAENTCIRAENDYIKAENAVIKKSIALRRQKWAEQLKAKKQRSSRNSARKDTR